jgi:hypothetical protein
VKPILEYEGREYFSEAELKARVAELDLEHAGETMPKASREEWNKINETIDEFEARRERLVELARGSRRGVESGDGATFRHDWNRVDDSQVDPRLREDRDAGLRAIQRHEGTLAPQAADRLDDLVRSHDPDGHGARYIDGVDDPAYYSAFGKMVMDPTTGHLRFTPKEVEAVRRSRPWAKSARCRSAPARPAVSQFPSCLTRRSCSPQWAP